ncbi:hypothetical protein BFP97_08095 [Roseivirga sp. 4D4]|uniref:AMP-binding protein n=1 Tax=Roseivirga sp. 4D4 TaxID=1889784 RepID=UPI0008529801|nr:AMP-binding protein [Roseivirga sp. 4D4]OEK01483.1 hypothetical protein BFP97_08095 [Roseivirga sp. 4D4]
MGLGKNDHWALSAQIFIRQWLNNQKTFSITTSGSTGSPKKINITREQMIASALATIKTLDLSEGTQALVCINTSFIGGQMMLVRGIIGNWQLELIEPSMEVNSFSPDEAYDFAALVPLQVSALVKTEHGKNYLNRIKKIIIGGAPVSKDLTDKLQQLDCECFHTYGMTETVSHVGLKALNGPNRSEWFSIVGDTKVRTNEQGCLEIKGAVTQNRWITTNDLVELKGGKFKWLGRADLVVNSGGVKILIESAEELIKGQLPQELSGTIALWKEEHQDLGESLIGMTNDKQTLEYIHKHNDAIKQALPKYHLPKTWRLIPSFQFTPSGKIDRASSLAASKA